MSPSSNSGLLQPIRSDLAAPSADRPSTLVVGYDGHTHSNDILAVAANFAFQLNVHLHVVHAIDLGDYPIDPDSNVWEEEAQKTIAAQQATASAVLQNHPIAWTYHVVRGDPAQMLSRVAAEHHALMIVVGSRGEGLRAAVQRLFSSPVSHRLIQHSDLPVLVVGATAASHPQAL